MVEQFSHTQDAGDLLVSLASVKSLGGGNYYLQRKKPQLYGLLKQLFDAQEYIGEFDLFRGQAITKDFSNFRKNGIPYGVQLGLLHSNWVKANAELHKPWLSVKPSSKSIGKIVVARSPRYQNPYFPWKALVEALRPHILFVGLEQEWKTFCTHYGHVDYIRTRNLHDVAQLIAGSELFIGNQSSPNAVAEGLKHPLVQETCLWVSDCIYVRDNAIHCYNGNLEFSFKGQRYTFETQRKRPRIVRSECPPGGWRVMVNNTEYNSYCFEALKNQVRLTYGSASPANLEAMIEEYTVSGMKLDAIPQGDLQQMQAIERIIASQS